MRYTLVLAVALTACREPVPPASEWLLPVQVAMTWNFDPGTTHVGGGQQGLLPALSVGAGDWKGVPAPDAPSPPNVVSQEAANDEAVFNVALLVTSYRDLDLSVKLKAVGGEIDQGGGLVWRATDARNYYVARFNPLESNFRLYKVVEGVRTQLASARADPAPGWRTLRVRMKGDAIECELDGRARLEAKDATFTAAGKIGLWTKADARTQFDDLSVR